MEHWKPGTHPEGVGLSTAERVQRILESGFEEEKSKPTKKVDSSFSKYLQNKTNNHILTLLSIKYSFLTHYSIVPLFHYSNYEAN